MFCLSLFISKGLKKREKLKEEIAENFKIVKQKKNENFCPIKMIFKSDLCKKIARYSYFLTD